MDEVEPRLTNVRNRDVTLELDSLVDNIAEIGLQQPIIVQPKTKGAYEVLVGQRRYLAHKKLGKETILALVPDVEYSPEEAILISLSENMHRRELDPEDLAEAVEFLYGRYEHYSDVARRLGISVPTVKAWLGFRSVRGELRQMVYDKKIPRTTAVKLVEQMPDEGRAVEMARYLYEKQPPAQTKTRIFDVIARGGDRSVEAIVKQADADKRIRRIQFDLAANNVERMARAEEEEQRTANELARDATIDWLDRRR